MNQKLLYFLTRIDSLTPNHKSKYDKISVNQIACHRTALKELSLIDTTKLLKEKLTIFFDSPKAVDFHHISILDI